MIKYLSMELLAQHAYQVSLSDLVNNLILSGKVEVQHTQKKKFSLASLSQRQRNTWFWDSVILTDFPAD